MRRKGAALPGAIALCSILLIVSITVSGTIVALVSNNKINRMRAENDFEFMVAHEKFIAANGSSDAEIATLLGDVNFRPHVYEKVGNPNIKSLVAWKKNVDEIKYYSIADFTDLDNIKILAYQTENLYITEDENFIYVGGYVEIDRG